MPDTSISPTVWSQEHNLLVIVGPTASGKTRLGVALAQHLANEGIAACEMISADSRQVFQGMNLGTGKDLGEYGDIPYHLIDIVAPGYEFSVYEFQQRFYEAYALIRQRGHWPILVGGSGLYVDAIVRHYPLSPVAANPALRAELSSWTTPKLEARLRYVRPEQHNTTDLESRERLIRAIEIAEGSGLTQQVCSHPALTPLIFGLRWERSLLRQRITARLQQRLEAGLVAEVESLLASGISPERLAAYGLEYRFVCRYLQGELTWEAFFHGLNQAIQQFSKRQETWFRRMERHGVTIQWLEATDDPLAEAVRFFMEN